MRWLRRSGQYQLLPPGQPVQLNHYIEVEGQDNARLIAEQLTRTFSTSWGLSPTDNGIGATRYQVVASHRHIPENKERITAEMALARAQRTIREVIGQVPGSRYAGWDRHPLPAEPPRRHQNDDGDDGDESDSSPFTPALPLRSG
jgi:hypothetical protein